MRSTLFLLPLLLCLNACAMYKQEFDCPVPQGVPCTSETDLEAMIIETSQGPDIFLPPQTDESGLPCHKSKECPAQRLASTLGRKVWMCNQTLEEGGYIQGHYIYQTTLPLINED